MQRRSVASRRHIKGIFESSSAHHHHHNTLSQWTA